MSANHLSLLASLPQFWTSDLGTSAHQSYVVNWAPTDGLSHWQSESEVDIVSSEPSAVWESKPLANCLFPFLQTPLLHLIYRTKPISNKQQQSRCYIPRKSCSHLVIEASNVQMWNKSCDAVDALVWSQCLSNVLRAPSTESWGSQHHQQHRRTPQGIPSNTYWTHQHGELEIDVELWP